MSVIKHPKETTTTLVNSSIGATKKILLSLPLISQLYNFCTPFLDFFIRYRFVRHTVSPPLNIAYRYYLQRCNQFLLEIDSCCYGSDYVLPRNSCQLQFSVLTAFFHVIPVSKIFLFQPPLSEFVLAFSLSSVPTADVRYVLALPLCYPVIPASKNSLVLAAWINFKVLSLFLL